MDKFRNGMFFDNAKRKVWNTTARSVVIPLVSTLQITVKFQELPGAPTKPQLEKRVVSRLSDNVTRYARRTSPRILRALAFTPWRTLDPEKFREAFNSLENGVARKRDDVAAPHRNPSADNTEQKAELRRVALPPRCNQFPPRARADRACSRGDYMTDNNRSSRAIVIGNSTEHRKNGRSADNERSLPSNKWCVKNYLSWLLL